MGVKPYNIYLNEYNGLYWKISIVECDYDDLKNFITDIANTEYKYILRKNVIVANGQRSYIKQADINNFKLLLSDMGYEYFQLIKHAGSELEIKTFKAFDRLLIYLICKIFSLNYNTCKKDVPLNVPRDPVYVVAIYNNLATRDDYKTIIRCQKYGVKICK